MAETRSEFIKVRVKPSEKKAYEAQAEKENKRFPEFVRDTLMNKVRRG